MEYSVLSPWGEKESLIQGIQPRVTTLNNKTIGLFSGHKGHWPLILKEVEQQLKEKFPKAKFSHFRYPKDCVDLADDAEYEASVKKWLKGVDTVVSGYGDATSCTLFLTYNTAFIEKLGKPAVIIMNRHFANVAGSGARSRGLNGLRMVLADIIDISGYFSHEGVVESVIRPGISAVIEDIITALTKPLTREEKSPTMGKEKKSRIVFKSDLEAVNRFFYKNGWSYGMPIIPPTEEAVKEMLTGTDLPAGHVVAVIPPMSGRATVEKIAVNAVMAGCLPTYMPVSVATPKVQAPEYIPFSEADWDKQVTSKAQELFLEVTPTSLYRAIWSVAQKLRVYYVNHIISFGYYFQAKAEAMFKAHFGFSYADRNKPESLAMLKDQCGKQPVTFEQYVAQDPLNSSVVVDELVNIIKNNEWVAKLAEKRQGIEYKLQTAPVNGFNYNDAYWNAKELYLNS